MRKRTPRTVRNPMEWINKRMPLADDQTLDLGLAYHVALDAMLSEHANESAWSTLVCSINVALMLAEQGIHAEAEPIIKLAQEALIKIRNQALKSGNWSINLAHHHQQAIFAAVNVHDLQCAMCTKAQIGEALNEIYRRIKIGEVMV